MATQPKRRLYNARTPNLPSLSKQRKTNETHMRRVILLPILWFCLIPPTHPENACWFRSQEVKKMPIKNLPHLIKDAEWVKTHPTIDIEPEITELASLYAKFWLKRWKEGTQESWTESRERNNYIGLIGQCCFEIVLQQLEAPYVYNHPAIDWRGKKDYDFRIVNIGKIEVKTVDYQENQQNLLIKCEEWHNSDYVIAIKLFNEKPTQAKFMGYATCKDVENFEYVENRQPCPYKPCYRKPLTELRSTPEFFTIIKNKTENLW